MARRYEFYVRMARTISRMESPSGLVPNKTLSSILQMSVFHCFHLYLVI